jgi:hypothetical protein
MSCKSSFQHIPTLQGWDYVSKVRAVVSALDPDQTSISRLKGFFTFWDHEIMGLSENGTET